MNTQETPQAPPRKTISKARRVLYRRPKRKADAPPVTLKQRSRFARELQEVAGETLPADQLAKAYEVLATADREGTRQPKEAWVGVRVRFEQGVMIELLQSAHLRNTRKEISKSDTVAALMLHGLRGLQELPEFTMKTLTTSY